MPTKKQRRRREKELRHEWEEVYVDAEGRELAPEEVEDLLPEEATRRKELRPKAPGRQKQAPARGRAAGRTVQPPSWRRVLKRGAIFAPLMYVFITLMNRGSSPYVSILITAQLLLIFLPFSYLMDGLTYRLWKKRQEKAAG
jgi:hypothetical protein